MILKRLGTGMLASNCYILGDEGEGVIIDPGAEADEIMDVVEQTGLKIKYVVLTHAHVDHIMSVDEVCKRTGALLVVHEKEARALGDPWFNGSHLFGLKRTFRDADLTVKHGDILEAGGMRLEMIHTPGHTSGGVCIRIGDSLFTGDTLFRMSIGRSDLGDGDSDELMDSLKNRLMVLEDKVTVYPGHGAATTIGDERRNNPFL